MTPPETDRDSDAALVERARAGDGDAFGGLVRRHERGARALAYSLVGNVADAEDLAQEAFLRALRNLDLLADPAKFAPWFHRVVFGTCIDSLRRATLPIADDEESLNIGSGEPSAHDALEHAELSARILAAIDALPPRYRTPLTMYHLDGVSHERVAEALGVPAATARSLVARARRKLAASLSDLDQGETRVFDTAPTPSMLHITNGDSTRGSLEQSSVPGTTTVWGDTLYEGPLPRDVDDVAFREARARFHAGPFLSYEECVAMGERWERGLASADQFQEVVLWFEHDLHDQLLLVNLLDWFARRASRPYVLSLICIGAFPAVEPFYGLGQLTPDQLASLLGTRQRVSERQLALGQSAWRALTGEDPRAIERVLARDTSVLPFLDGALRRLLEDFPDAWTGLPRTERTLLELLAEHGEMPFVELFPAHMKTEERPFMGDWTIWGRLEDLAAGPRPLVHRDEATDNATMLRSRIRITDDGRRVLAGELDWMAIGPFDRWIGGSHLVAPQVRWRWSRDSLSLASI